MKINQGIIFVIFCIKSYFRSQLGTHGILINPGSIKKINVKRINIELDIFNHFFLTEYILLAIYKLSKGSNKTQRKIYFINQSSARFISPENIK